MASAPEQTPSPEPLDLLLATLPRQPLLALVKANAPLARIVFQGFAARLQSLALPFVRERIIREAAKSPEVADQLYQLWRHTYAELMARINAPEFTARPEHLAPLTAQYGVEAVRYALLHADREEVRGDLSGVMPAPRRPAPAPTTPPPPPPKTDETDARLRALQQSQQAAQRALEAAQAEIATLKREAAEAARAKATLHKQVATLERALEREQRRVKAAEEELVRLRKTTRISSPAPAPATTPAPAAATPEMTDLLRDAIAMLQRGLEGQSPTAPAEPATPPPAPAPPPPTPRTPLPPEAVLELPTARGKRKFTLAAIRKALLHNDATTVDAVRDGLARLAEHPVREREALARLAKVGIPAAVLTGPLRPAVVDGSNVANMAPASRGRLAYLQQIQQSAWEEGYFPVIIIVDASLRHQIDQPDELMALVESGRITMTEPGSSADPLLITEAIARHAVLISNDRMTEWPDAKTLDRRKASLRGDRARIGNFHTSSSLFDSR